MASMTMPPPGPVPIQDEKTIEIVNILEGYRLEAENNRRSGPNPRDDKWRENADLYWNRYDFSTKADWQAKEVMPEVPSFVDRFAGAMKDALVSVPDGFYTVEDPYDTENDMADKIKAMNDVWLSSSGRNQVGTPLDFSATFEEQMKLGAIKACCGTVLWKNDVPGGRVAFETIDPQFVWLDHTYRGLYRMRRVELDKIDLINMVRDKDTKGNPIFNLDEIQNLVTSLAVDTELDRSRMSGSGEEITSNRKPVQLDEYMATVVTNDGKVIAENGLFVVANNRFLLRGPEANPFWHGRDWLVYAPLVTAPLSVYGRSYMEDFGSLARTFNEVTNMLIDAVHMSAMNAFVVVPGMLLNPDQLATGMSPNKMFMLDEGFRAEDFAKDLQLGKLDQGAVQFWSQLKSELSEAAGVNEIGMGQFAPKSRTSATEVSETQASSSALIRSVAQTVETRFLNPVLDLHWKTGVQHLSPRDKRMTAAVGEDWMHMITTMRRDFVRHPITFQARGISNLIQKSQMLQKLLSLLQIVAANPQLMQAFLQKVDVNKLLALMFNLSGIDPSKLATSDREQLISQIMGPMAQVAGQAEATPEGLNAMGGATAAAGIGVGS